MKTTVEQFIIELLENQTYEKDGYVIINLSIEAFKFFSAKAMKYEKHQIIESWDNGFANGYDLGKFDDYPQPQDAEQYYNETFKSE